MKHRWTSHPRASSRIKALLACGVLLGSAALGTSALWSTTAATSSEQFTTADLRIAADGMQELTFSFSDTLLPGGSTAYLINVQNIGHTPFTYTATVKSDSPLGQAMTLATVPNVTPADHACPGAGGGVSIATEKEFRATTSALAAVTGVDPLCLQLTLPTTADGALAGKGGSVTFTFTATGA